MSAQRPRPLRPLTVACTACGCGDKIEENTTDQREGRQEVKDWKCSVFRKEDAGGCQPFPVEGGGRYILYVAAGCPFAARPWLIAEMTGLTQTGAIRVVKAFPGNGKEGWFFKAQNDEERAFVDRMQSCIQWNQDEPRGCMRVRELYNETADKEGVNYTGVVSIPILYDTVKGLIVSNDSIDISWMLAVEFADHHSAEWKASGIELFPQYLDEEHAALIQDVHSRVNLGVYRTHMDTSQQGYEEKLQDFWAGLDEIGGVLCGRPFLMTGVKGAGGVVHGGTPVFADLMLFATLIRLDLAYGPAFRVGYRRVRDCKPLFDYMRRLFRMPGARNACDLRGIICTYYTSVPLRAKNGGTVPPLPLGFLEALEMEPGRWDARAEPEKPLVLFAFALGAASALTLSALLRAARP